MIFGYEVKNEFLNGETLLNCSPNSFIDDQLPNVKAKLETLFENLSYFRTLSKKELQKQFEDYCENNDEKNIYGFLSKRLGLSSIKASYFLNSYGIDGVFYPHENSCYIFNEYKLFENNNPISNLIKQGKETIAKFKNFLSNQIENFELLEIEYQKTKEVILGKFDDITIAITYVFESDTPIAYIKNEKWIVFNSTYFIEEGYSSNIQINLKDFLKCLQENFESPLFNSFLIHEYVHCLQDAKYGIKTDKDENYFENLYEKQAYIMQIIFLIKEQHPKTIKDALNIFEKLKKDEIFNEFFNHHQTEIIDIISDWFDDYLFEGNKSINKFHRLIKKGDVLF